MRSKRLSAQLAYDWGIINEVVADEDLERETDKLVKELLNFSPLAQRTAKKILNQTEDMFVSAAIEMEGQAYSRLRTSDDFQEGVAAFHDKRRSFFKGT